MSEDRLLASINLKSKEKAQEKVLWKKARFSFPSVKNEQFLFSSSSRSNPTLMPILSIMILTFAFFVTLTSFSQKEEEKWKQALDSLQTTFSFPFFSSDSSPEQNKTHLVPEQLMQNIFYSVRNIVPDTSRILRPAAEEIEITIPIMWLFAKEDSRLSTAAISLLQEIDNLLNRRKKDYFYEISFLLVSTHLLSDIEFDRISTIALVLAHENDLDQKKLFLVVPGNENALKISIRLSMEDNFPLNADSPK